MFLLRWHNTAWLKEKTRWLLLYLTVYWSHNVEHTTTCTQSIRIHVRLWHTRTFCTFSPFFCVSHTQEPHFEQNERALKKNNNNNDDSNRWRRWRRPQRHRRMVWIIRFEHVFIIAHSPVVRKSITNWKLFQRVIHTCTHAHIHTHQSAVEDVVIIIVSDKRAREFGFFWRIEADMNKKSEKICTHKRIGTRMLSSLYWYV